MVIRSPYPDLDIPEQDVLTYLFPSENSLSERPLWINAASPDSYLSLRTGLQWIKRLAVGLDNLGVKRGDVLMMVSPNHIFVPIAYLGAVGSARIFSGANPLYTADGMEELHCSCDSNCMQIASPVASTISYLERIQTSGLGLLLCPRSLLPLSMYTHCSRLVSQSDLSLRSRLMLTPVNRVELSASEHRSPSALGPSRPSRHSSGSRQSSRPSRK